MAGRLRSPGTYLAAVVALAAPVLAAAPPAAAAGTGVTVSGYVYDDTDGDGHRDPLERGVENVVVSDGRTLVSTDRKGHYQINVDPDRRRTDLVWVSQPAGYVLPTDADSQPRFFATVAPDAAGNAVADFALLKDARANDTDYKFVGMADVHVQAGTTNNRQRFSDQISQINGLVASAGASPQARKVTPRFAVVSGDLTNNGTAAEFGDYRASVRTSTLPVWPALGNHEYNVQLGNTYADIIENYRTYIGPEWYSFNYGDKHYVVLDGVNGLGEADQLTWLAEDLRLARGRHVVVITHVPLNTALSANPAVSARYIGLFEQYDTALLLAGHTHTNDVDDAVIDGALHAVTNSASYTIDGTPNGFRVVQFAADKVSIPFREFDVKQRSVTLVQPADGGQLPRAKTTVQVNTFHTSSDVKEVAVRLNNETKWRKLTAAGDRTWTAAFDASKLALGKHRMQARVTQTDGTEQTADATFEVVATVTAPVTGTAWSQFHSDAGHSGTTPDVLAPPLGLAWAHHTGGSILTSSPAIAGALAYVGVRDENGTAHNGVAALDVKTGQQRWWAATDAQVDGSVAVSGDTVLASSIRGTLYGLDAASGGVRWTFKVGESAGLNEPRRAWMYSAPTVSGDTVYQAYSIADGMHVAALDVRTGAQRWVSGVVGSTWISKGTVVAGEGRVFALAQGGQVTALDAATGAVQWQKNPGGSWTYASATVTNGLLLRPFSGDYLVAMDAATGTEKWRYRSPGASYIYGTSTASTPAVAGGLAYQGFTDGSVTAIDLATGTAKWTQRTGHAVLSSPAVSGDTVYVGSNDGRVRGFDRNTGQPLWSYDLGAWVASSPAVSGNALVVGAWDGGVYAFTPASGPAVPRWSVIEGAVTSDGEAAAGAQVLVRSTADHKVLAQTTTGADGRFSTALPGGTYDVQTLIRGHAPASRTVTLAANGARADGSLTLSRLTEPVAGLTDLPADYGTASTRTDTMLGTTYGYVANGKISASIVPTVAGNNAAGTAQPGWLADLTLADENGSEFIDWSEHTLTTAKPGAPDWNRPGEWLSLPQITASGDTVTAAGSAQIDPNLKAKLAYRALPDAPVVEMTLELTNSGTTDFTGYYQYAIDPDSPVSSNDVARVPGLSNNNPGYVASGWTANYLYDGPTTTTSGGPAQGLAWPAAQPPVTLSAQGYVAGLWFDASVQAGGTRTIRWYHITDYPAAGSDPTAAIAAWAAKVA
ncbi:PQQ-binding-like beta-propeller repeat protein [Micromonospora krabiensis]|uniref:alpha-amylase n=1 Tax=Micromonospora krabiensis TaxID=307121 RepID=A0A1C3N162_9ACTN|nr:PQQ-binding-like beta-propeller repeat protein [Micromonospora krabiensis]SBV26343.1 Outer membrane protein assembly factor BamB, contains PQQ-like beta-propeller repeat [Micromonospora krabiensis]